MKIFNLTHPYCTAYSIKTDCNRLSEVLKLKYGNYLTAANAPLYNTITALKDTQGYKISFNGKTFATERAVRQIDDIIYSHREYNKDIFAIHGGAVEHCGGAYLFIAATTSGKTTLTAYLCESGFGYITDDCILLNRQSFKIYPYLKPLHLRGGGYDILKKLNKLPKNLTLLNDASLIRQVYTPKNCAKSPLPLKKIFFIERTEQLNLCEAMGTTEKITELLKSPIKEQALSSEYIAFISKLAAVPCYRLRYCDMEFCAEVIKNG